MSPREIIGRWFGGLNRNWDVTPVVGLAYADMLLKALDEQGLAVVPKPRNTPIEKLIGFK
jgi:hypothetical protein